MNTAELPLAPSAPPVHRIALVALVLVAAILAVYGRTCGHQFLVWDDPFFVDRPAFKPPKWESLLDIWTTAHKQIYVPVAGTVWWLLAHVAYRPGRGLNPAIFHIGSIAVHCASTLLVLCVLRRITKGLWAPAAGAALFALHPLQAECVAWASELKDLLGGCFALAGICLYLYIVQTDSQPRRPRIIAAWFMTLAAFELAALSKPTAALGPAMAALIDYLFCGRPLKQVLKLATPILLLCVPWLLVARAIQPEPAGIHLSWLGRFYVPGDTLYFYLGKLLAPIGLVPDYARDPDSLSKLGYCYWTWIIPVALGAVLIGIRRKHAWLPAAAAVALIPVLPMLGATAFDFQVFSTVADHYLYLAMLGPAIAAACLVNRLGTPAWRWVAAAAVAALGAISFVQAGWWRDDITLWSRTLDVNPNSAIAMKGLGSAIMKLGPDQQPLAMELLANALQQRPDDPHAIEYLAQHWLAERNDVKVTQWLRRLDAMDERLPPDSQRVAVETAIGDLLLKRGRAQDAATWYRKALSFDADCASAKKGLQEIHDQIRPVPATAP